MHSPTITVIIPRKPDGSAEDAIQAVQQCDYPQHLIEILEVIGESPSKQRNTAAQQAQGEILYFLDNDSIVTPTLFSRIVKYYAGSCGVHAPNCTPDHNTLAGIGGPNLTPLTDNFLQKTFGYALASPFAHFSMCARYKPTGALRYSDEKELILCNLSLRKDIFFQEHGFDETMYPNEENEFINRVMAKGYQFLYDPDAYVYRSRRNQFLGFIRQLSHYGRGRADQILLEGFSLKSLMFFLPLGLLSYLVGLAGLDLSGLARWWMYLPLGVYGVLACLSALQFAFQERNPLLAVLLPFWYLVMHVSYGAGLLQGFVKAWFPKKLGSDIASLPVKVVVRQAL